MPIGKRFDIQLNGKGYMLVRGEGRSWHRTGLPDIPGRRSPEDAKYGVLPDEIDHPEVWNDWSGGAFHPYRRNGENTYHWATGFDARFPKQLVHAQNPKVIDATLSVYRDDIQRIEVIPPIGNGSYNISNQPTLQLKGGQGRAQVAPSTGSLHEIGNSVHTWRTRWRRGAYYKGGVVGAWIRSYDGANVVTFLTTTDVSQYTGLPYLDMVNASDRIWISIGASGNYRAAVQSIIGDVQLTANLSATLLIGNSNMAITDMATVEDQLFVGLPNGLYAGDQSGTFVNVMPQLDKATNPDNFRDLMPWNGGLLAQHSQGLYFYQAGDSTAQVSVIPTPTGVLRSPYQGYVRALGNVGPWVYAGKWTGSNSYLMASKDIGLKENPAWHTLQEFPVQCIDRIVFDGITTGSASPTTRIPQRAWASMSADQAATYPAYYWEVPWSDDNPLIPAIGFSANYIGSARMDLGNVDFGAPGTPKGYRSLEVWADNLLSGYRYCDVYYYGDQTNSQMYLGRAQNSPNDTIYFPSGDGSTLTSRITGSIQDANNASLITTNVAADERVTISVKVDNAGGKFWRVYGKKADASNVNITAPFNTTFTLTTGEPRLWDYVAIGIGPTTVDSDGSTDLTLGIGRDLPVSGQSIELSVRSFTASPFLSPVYRAFVLRGAMRPNSVDTITAQVRIADGIRDRQGGEMRSGATMLSELRALATASQAAPVTLIDLIGAQHIVNVLPPIEEQEYYQKGEDYPEIMAQVKLSVMVYS